VIKMKKVKEEIEELRSCLKHKEKEINKIKKNIKWVRHNIIYWSIFIIILIGALYLIFNATVPPIVITSFCIFLGGMTLANLLLASYVLCFNEYFEDDNISFCFVVLNTFGAGFLLACVMLLAINTF